MKPISTVKESEIYAALVRRKTELGLSNIDISEEAFKHGVKIQCSQLSKYFSRKDDYGLSEFALLWLCNRYCISVDLVVEKKEYDEQEGLLNITLKYSK